MCLKHWVITVTNNRFTLRLELIWSSFFPSHLNSHLWRLRWSTAEHNHPRIPGQRHNSLSGKNNRCPTPECHYLVDTDTCYDNQSPDSVSEDAKLFLCLIIKQWYQMIYTIEFTGLLDCLLLIFCYPFTRISYLLYPAVRQTQFVRYNVILH